MGGILALLLSNLPTIFSAIPQIAAIAKAGVPVLSAWEQVSPELLPLIKGLASTVFGGSASDFEHEIIAALLGQVQLTPEQQARWDDHMAGVDPVTGHGPEGA